MQADTTFFSAYDKIEDFSTSHHLTCVYFQPVMITPYKLAISI